jgi:hypothetical protein
MNKKQKNLPQHPAALETPAHPRQLANPRVLQPAHPIASATPAVPQHVHVAQPTRPVAATLARAVTPANAVPITPVTAVAAVHAQTSHAAIPAPTVPSAAVRPVAAVHAVHVPIAAVIHDPIPHVPQVQHANVSGIPHEPFLFLNFNSHGSNFTSSISMLKLDDFFSILNLFIFANIFKIFYGWIFFK